MVGSKRQVAKKLMLLKNAVYISASLAVLRNFRNKRHYHLGIHL